MFIKGMYQQAQMGRRSDEVHVPDSSRPQGSQNGFNVATWATPVHTQVGPMDVLPSLKRSRDSVDWCPMHVDEDLPVGLNADLGLAIFERDNRTVHGLRNKNWHPIPRWIPDSQEHHSKDTPQQHTQRGEAGHAGRNRHVFIAVARHSPVSLLVLKIGRHLNRRKFTGALPVLDLSPGHS